MGKTTKTEEIIREPKPVIRCYVIHTEYKDYIGVIEKREITTLTERIDEDEVFSQFMMEVWLRCGEELIQVNVDYDILYSSDLQFLEIGSHVHTVVEMYNDDGKPYKIVEIEGAEQDETNM